MLLFICFLLCILIFFFCVIICCWQRTVNICATRYEHLFWLRVTINMAISSTRRPSPWGSSSFLIPPAVDAEIEIWILSAHILCFLFAGYLFHARYVYIVRNGERKCGDGANVHSKSGFVSKGAWVENIAHFVYILCSHIQVLFCSFLWNLWMSA